MTDALEYPKTRIRVAQCRPLRGRSRAGATISSLSTSQYSRYFTDTSVRVSVVVGALPNPVSFVDTNIRRVQHRVFVGPDVPEPVAKEPALLVIAEKWCRLRGTPPGPGTRRLWRSESVHLGELRFHALLDNDCSQQIRFE